MDANYIVGICLCCFGIGLTLGIVTPFICIAIYNKMCDAFDMNLDNVIGE